MLKNTSVCPRGSNKEKYLNQLISAINFEAGSGFGSWVKLFAYYLS